MTFSKFVVSLKPAFPEAQHKTVAELLKNAGVEALPPDNTIKSWLNRSKRKEGEIKVPCDPESVFPDLVMEEHKFMDYIRKRIYADIWKKVQEAFASEVGPGDVVDVHTDDHEVFCESIMRHFYRLFGLHPSGDYEFKSSPPESDAAAEVEATTEPSQPDDNLEPEQIEIAPPQDEEEQASLALDSEDNDSTVSELSLSVTEPESEPTPPDVLVSEIAEESSSAPPYPCEDFMNLVKKYAFDIDVFLKRKVKDIYEDEFRQVQPVMAAFLEILPRLQATDDKPTYPYPPSVKQFIKAFREYYEFFQEHHLYNLTIRDHTIYSVDKEIPVILLSEPLHDELSNGDKLRKEAKKLYSVAKEDAAYAVKRYHEMIE